MSGDLATEGKTQIGDVLGLVAPVVNANQKLRFEAVPGFFKRLANGGFGQRLAAFEVASRLVVADSVVGFLFDEQKFSVVLKYGSNGDMGFPDHEIRLGIRGKPVFYLN